MRYLFLFSSFFIIFHATSQVSFESFDFPTYYDEESGIQANNIHDIDEDDSGFIWLATNKGIIRYDGNRFIQFNSFESQDGKGQLDIIYSIAIDRTNNMLWGGGKNGLFYSSLDNIQFKQFPIWTNMHSTNYPAIRSLLLDNNLTMWVAGLNGIASIELNDQELVGGQIREPSIKQKIDISGINTIILDDKNSDILWATGVGIYEINISSSTFKRYLYKDNSQNHENSARSINQTSDKLILGTYSAGAILFDKGDKTFSHFKEDFLNVKDDIYSIKKDGSGFWFTTPKGIVQLDYSLTVTKGIKENNLKQDLIYGLTFIDSRGVPWFGFSRGLFSYGGKTNNVNFVQLESYSQLDRSLLITAIVPFEGNYFVAGYSSHGIYKLNPNTQEREVLILDTVEKDVDGLYNTSDVIKTTGDSLLMSVNNTLVFFNLKTERFSLSPLQIPANDLSIKALEIESEGVYWVGGRRNGLFRVDYNEGNVENYNDKLLLKEGSMPWINELFIDSKDHLWVAKGSRSLISLKDMVSKSVPSETDIPFYQDVYQYYEDHKGRIWLAGGTDGLGYIDAETIKDGVKQVKDETYEGIFKRNDSTVWLMDDNLKVFNLNTFNIESVLTQNRLGPHKLTGPLYQDKDVLIIGCKNGVILYKEPVKDWSPPQLYLQEISVNGNTFYRGQSLIKKSFNLPRNTRNLSAQVGFFGFDDQNTIPAQFQYRTNDRWIDLDPQGNINITNLDQGLYTLDFRSIDNNMEAGIVQFQFEIKPYWYNSSLAYSIYLVLLAVSIYALYKFNLRRKLAIAESKNAKKLIDYKSRMYTNITHEFRTPLTVILGLSDTIKSDLKEGNIKHAKESSKIIERNGKALLQLVNQLLGISKVESGTMEVKMVQADVIQFLRYIYESFKTYAEKSEIEFIFYAEIETFYMDFDDEKLQTIVSNLISNAIKFTPPTGQVVFHIAINKDGKAPVLTIKIKDNGYGIPKKSLPYIFDRFYQVDHVKSKSSSGTGIGLSMSKELAELMGGTLSVKSSVNKGTTMCLKLPITNSSELLSTANLQKLNRITVSTDQPNWSTALFSENQHLPQVLVIEDNDDVIYYLKICLHNHYKVVIARDGQEGINIALKEIPDIIISDIMMPIKDGYEVCRTLKKDPRTDHIPIILLTAKSTESNRIKGLSCGADAYLNKPFLKAELLTRLDQLVLLRKRLVQSLTQSKYSQILNSEKANPETKFLKKVINLIHEQIDNPELGSSLLSQALNMSESQIYRKIKAVTGKSTAIFIRSVRLEKAKDLVQSSDKSISEIAYMVGFNDPSWFTRAFKKEYGRSPKSYQN